MIKNSKGYTLVELVVVMGIFLVVIIISTSAFERIIRTGGQQVKSAQSQITGQVGLEMMRAAIGHAGYGLFWSFQGAPINYTEVAADGTPAAGLFSDISVFNGLNDSGVAPRAVVTGTSSNGTYLVIKSTMAPMNTMARKWSFMNYSVTPAGDNVSYIRAIKAPDPAFGNADRAVVVNTSFSAGESKQLAANGTTFFYNFAQPLNTAFMPVDKNEKRFVYGVANQDLRMPYNRTDFYLDMNPPKKPQSCNPGTGVLYMAVAGQNGDYTDINRSTALLYPLLDCVGDMQVNFDLLNEAGNLVPINTLIDPDNPLVPLDAEGVRTKLKNVRVYLLAQEGKKDTGFSYPGATINVGDEFGIGREWSAADMAAKFGSDWRNYRWKVYSFAVNLKNLQ